MLVFGVGFVYRNGMYMVNGMYMEIGMYMVKGFSRNLHISSIMSLHYIEPRKTQTIRIITS